MRTRAAIMRLMFASATRSSNVRAGAQKMPLFDAHFGNPNDKARLRRARNAL